MGKNKARNLTIIAILILVIVIGGGFWYYLSQVRQARIEKILSRPGEYTGKLVTIEGEVTDRTAFFTILKFFKLRDRTGEIVVVTKGRALPEVNSKVRVKGIIDQAFSIGDQKLVIFVAESVDKREQKK